MSTTKWRENANTQVPSPTPSMEGEWTDVEEDGSVQEKGNNTEEEDDSTEEEDDSTEEEDNSPVEEDNSDHYDESECQFLMKMVKWPDGQISTLQRKDDIQMRVQKVTKGVFDLMRKCREKD